MSLILTEGKIKKLGSLKMNYGHLETTDFLVSMTLFPMHIVC
jgi:hypothetical protein